MTREVTLDRIDHPAWLRVEWSQGASTFSRVDGALVAPFAAGEPSLGWEGDNRLAMYWDAEGARYVLMRLEANGEYGPVVLSAPYSLLNEAMVNEVIAGLVSHDVRRGFNPKQYVDSTNAALDDAKRKRELDRIDNDLADKLRWALIKDLG